MHLLILLADPKCTVLLKATVVYSNVQPPPLTHPEQLPVPKSLCHFLFYVIFLLYFFYV